MDDVYSRSPGTVTPSTGTRDRSHAVAWRDLREWLALAERHAQLKRIDREVDPVEELAAITFMATRGGGP